MHANLPSLTSGPPPLRILCVVAAPSDLGRFDEVRVWRDIAEAFEPFTNRGSVILERLPSPTESSLRQKLAENVWHVVYFVGHAQARVAARYATVSLVASDGRARNLTANALASLLASSSLVRLAILQACDEAASFDGIPESLVERGIAAVTLPASAPVQPALAKLCSGVLEELSGTAIIDSLPAPARVFIRDTGESIFPKRGNMVVAPAMTAPGAGQGRPVDQAPPAWHRELQRKRAAGVFDVFLCHKSGDKPAVMRIGQRLKEAGILPWLDVWELPPGQPWQPLLEQQIGSIRSAAVFVGSGGLGPWQEQEMYGFLREFVGRKAPVIPVLLQDAPSAPDLPIFLRAMTWVDFRRDDPDPLAQLRWGITGERPEN